mmetsp:Transcript_14773/g.22228  ORF Transcript_14773/g.22228 Transcript_14773/m.22228 type:complete len:346 (-) Transcript_14773:55-1092(-)
MQCAIQIRVVAHSQRLLRLHRLQPVGNLWRVRQQIAARDLGQFVIAQCAQLASIQRVLLDREDQATCAVADGIEQLLPNEISIEVNRNHVRAMLEQKEQRTHGRGRTKQHKIALSQVQPLRTVRIDQSNSVRRRLLNRAVLHPFGELFAQRQSRQHRVIAFTEIVRLRLILATAIRHTQLSGQRLLAFDHVRHIRMIGKDALVHRLLKRHDLIAAFKLKQRVGAVQSVLRHCQRVLLRRARQHHIIHHVGTVTKTPIALFATFTTECVVDTLHGRRPDCLVGFGGATSTALAVGHGPNETRERTRIRSLRSLLVCTILVAPHVEHHKRSQRHVHQMMHGHQTQKQ